VSLHYHLLKVSVDDVPRLRAAIARNGLGRSVLIDAAPFSFRHAIVACPADTGDAEIVRGEVASETIGLDDLRAMR